MAWLNSAEALRRLKVRPQSLYAYVSRGRIEARADPVDPKRSLYWSEDVDRLAGAKSRPRKAADVAAETISFGEPVLASSLTTIARGRLFYRGRDAIELSRTDCLEDIAALLWGDFSAAPAAEAPPTGPLKSRLFAALAAMAGRDPASRGRTIDVLVERAGLVFEALVAAASGESREGAAHQRLADAWRLDAHGADVIRRTLVLLADHELNASTFAARVCASTGASLSACALAGLATLSGPLHGLAVLRVLDFVADAHRMGAAGAVRARLDQGRAIPGFGHQLYPEGDPRAACLLAALKPPALIAEIIATVAKETGFAPNIDFAIAAMTFTFNLDRDAPFAIFAVGRSVGWLAHAIEQAATGSLIRPRARYVGPPPTLD